MVQRSGAAMQAALVATLLVSGCKPLIALEELSGNGGLRGELVRLDPGPPPAEDGICWEGDITPTVIETVTEQVQVAPETLAPDGSVATPAIYRTETRQRIAQEREVVWFRAPCDSELTVDFVASLQRALKARGYLDGLPTGQMDAATSEAVRRYQAEQGLDSPRLSLAAARQLGLSIVPVEEL